MSANPHMPTTHDIQALYDNGVAIKDIAQHFGCNRGSISRRLRLGAEPLGKQPKYNKDRIRQLRKKGKTVYEVARIIGCSAALVSMYTDDMVLSDDYIRARRDQWARNVAAGPSVASRRARERRDAIFNKFADDTFDSLDIFIAGLYAGEGAKTSGRFSVSNSNPSIIQCVMTYLRKLKVPENHILLVVQVYDSENPINVKAFWASKLLVDADRIRVQTKPVKAGVFRHTLPYGTVNVFVTGTLSIPMFERVRAASVKFFEPEGRLYKGELPVYWKNYASDQALGNVPIGEPATCVYCGSRFIKNKQHQRFCGSACACRHANPTRPAPAATELVELLKDHTKQAIGRMYSVSDATVRNWCRRHNIPLSRGALLKETPCVL